MLLRLLVGGVAVLLVGCQWLVPLDRRPPASADRGGDRPHVSELGDAPLSTDGPIRADLSTRSDGRGDRLRVLEPRNDRSWPPDLAADKPPLPDASPILFEDTFTSGTKLVNDSSGSWGVGSGQYFISSCTYHVPFDSWAPGQSWGDVKVSAQFGLSSQCSAGDTGLIARVVNGGDCSSNQYYFCLISLNFDNVVAGRRDHGCEWASYKFTNLAAGAIKKSFVYDLVMIVKGTTVTCTVTSLAPPNSATYTDATGIPFLQGSAGVFVEEGSAAVDNFKVEKAP